MKARLLLLLSFLSLTVSAQRKMNYYPEGKDLICVNGQNRYTRALYGGHSTWRLETSDHPVFATYSGSRNNRNVSFFITYKGVTLPLDSTDFCESRYRAGRRDYLLRDKRWGNAELRLSVLAYIDKEGAIFRFSAKDFLAPITIEGQICKNRLDKFVRGGDIGSFETKDKFEASQNKEFLQTCTLTTKDTLSFITLEDQQLRLAPTSRYATIYSDTERARKTFSETVSFTTPDALFNPIGEAMMMACDGAWDGKVWNHGAVGWHSQLPGWRGAYMGDFLGMPDRQRTHFTAYAKSQVQGVPVTRPHLMDESNNLARGTYEWGTPMYSDGYICRRPENNHEFHHYDMNLIYIDELLWHFQFDADTLYMREMWDVLTRHLAWEKNAWDPDGDHLYDAYCCIWASDALGYNSGAVTHSSAYNYRANLLCSRIAEIIGEDGTPYRNEARAILEAMNRRLWLSTEGHWAEYQDFMGKKRLHTSPAVWSIYTPIDCGACTPEQAYRATRFADTHIPHLKVTDTDYTISTSRWAPYEWSVNNVAMAEVLHTALAYYEAGRADEAFRLLRGTVIDFMYAGQSPANFGQLSSLDHSTGEAYRDFADVTGIASRTFIQGLYGITPQALDGICIVRPGFPSHWDSASIRTPYINYTFERKDGKDHFRIEQNFKRPLTIVLRQNLGEGKYKDTVLTADKVQEVSLPTVKVVEAPAYSAELPDFARASSLSDGEHFGTSLDEVEPEKCRPLDMGKYFNANVSDIFQNRYLTPRSPYTTLCIPTQGVGDWCSTKRMVNINDSVFRSLARDDRFVAERVPLSTPQTGRNISYVSLWDNYPDSLTLPLSGKASHLYLLMAGSTNPMQSQIANAELRVRYKDGTCDTLQLINPDNWCPIEQDYYHDAAAFPVRCPHPVRIGLATGVVSRNLTRDLHQSSSAALSDLPSSKQPAQYIDGGAAQLLDMHLNPRKRLHSLTLEALSNEVVIGLMSVTVQIP